MRDVMSQTSLGTSHSTKVRVISVVGLKSLIERSLKNNCLTVILNWFKHGQKYSSNKLIYSETLIKGSNNLSLQIKDNLLVNKVAFRWALGSDPALALHNNFREEASPKYVTHNNFSLNLWQWKDSRIEVSLLSANNYNDKGKYLRVSLHSNNLCLDKDQG